MSQFKTKQFKKLQAKWYSRLEKEGFKDLENASNDLIVFESTSFQNRYDPKKAESTTEYYRLACQFVWEHTFKTPRDKLIWELHANGVKQHPIADIIRKKRMRGGNQSQINDTIKALEKEMLAKYGKKDNKSKRINYS